VFFAAFCLLQFDFVIFCQKNIGPKAARNILMKFTIPSLECVSPQSFSTFVPQVKRIFQAISLKK